MLVGLNTFPLGAHLKKVCTICDDYSYDACEGFIIPAVQQGELVTTVPINGVVEIYSGEDATSVECNSTCSDILVAAQCQTFAGTRPKYSLFMHNGNVYALIKSGRVESVFIITADVHREYDQPSKKIIVRVTIR